MASSPFLPSRRTSEANPRAGQVVIYELPVNRTAAVILASQGLDPHGISEPLLIGSITLREPEGTRIWV